MHITSAAVWTLCMNYNNLLIIMGSVLYVIYCAIRGRVFTVARGDLGVCEYA